VIGLDLASDLLLADEGRSKENEGIRGSRDVSGLIVNGIANGLIGSDEGRGQVVSHDSGGRNEEGQARASTEAERVRTIRNNPIK
jgi:hypothetical protein